MKIIVDKKFAARFAIAAGVAPSRSPTEILRNVLVTASYADGIVLKATDTEKGISVKAEGTVQLEGSVLLPRDRATAILREIDGDAITIEDNGNEVFVCSKHAEFKLPSEDPAKFPKPIIDIDGACVELTGEQLHDLLAATNFATDPDSTRFALGGVSIEVQERKILAIGTDGRRLAMASASCADYVGPMTTSGKTIVPKSFAASLIQSIDKAENCTVRANDSVIVVTNDGIVLSSRLIEGRFPNWNNVIPNTKDWPIASIKSEAFAKLIRQAQITQDGETRGIQLRFSKDKLTATSSTKETGSSNCESDCSYSGEDMQVRLDSKFLLDFAKVVDPDMEVEIRASSATMPVVLSPKLTDSEYKYVLMPMASE